MNNQQLNQQLNADKPVMANVDDDLHRRVMGAVRRAAVEPTSARSFGFVPMLAGGAAATLAAVLIWNNAAQTPVTQPDPQAVIVDETVASDESINQRVATIGNQVRLPEAALRQELQRLESDLKRLRFNS
jgi:hypothetical protein